MLHLDPFTEADFMRLDAVRSPRCVSIFLPTHTVSRETDQDRILLKDLIKAALAQMEDDGEDKAVVAALRARFEPLRADQTFWDHLGVGLAIFATAESIEVYRLPRAVLAHAEVSDRFHLKPLVPLLTFPRTALLLELSQNEVRLSEISEGEAHAIDAPGMPTSLEAYLTHLTGGGLSGAAGSENKVRERQFTRAVEAAIKPVLAGRTTPLVLAGVETIVSLYREADTYAHTLSESISGNQAHRARGEAAGDARRLVESRFNGEIRGRLERVASLRGAGLSSTDVAEISQAAKEGRVETLMVDVENEIYGQLGDKAVGSAPDAATASTYDLLDELVGLTLRKGGEVFGVVEDKLPKGVKAAAIFRYAA